MANENYEKDWKKFLKCKECWEFKEINPNNWYYHSEGYLWVLGRCKECIKKWRRTEHELQMARIRDKNRYENNKKRREFIFVSAKKRQKIRSLENPKRVSNHSKTDKKIRQLWVRPKVCPICWYEWRIVAHHPDINIWNEIVFCCQICHDKIHRWRIECPKPFILDKSRKKYEFNWWGSKDYKSKSSNRGRHYTTIQNSIYDVFPV